MTITNDESGWFLWAIGKLCNDENARIAYLNHRSQLLKMDRDFLGILETESGSRPWDLIGLPSV